ncbi:MAG TPA: aspartate aminotransferase family protein [Chloroflexota bacterium]|nr:aspartate aminotransferase family protein [Chloroflexota bacterium]
MAVPTTPTETFGNRFLEPGSRSATLFERARKVLPGGNTRTTVFNPPHPLYLVAGQGCRVTDADGQTRLDFLNNYTSLLHGHCHPDVQAAAQAQLLRGTAFAGPTELEVDLAEIITDRVPAIERIRFTNSGTEGVMMAIKAARGYTGRPKIAKFEGFYHGTYDPAEVSVNPPLDVIGEAEEPIGVSETAGLAPGTIDSTVILPYNNPAAVERIVEREAANLAAVVVDPLPNNAGFPDPAPGFLPFLRELTQKHGILLICDEIISFRVGYQGASARFGIKPDLVTLGKIIGGGLPVGAVGGSAEAMSVFDPTAGKPRVPHGGTFNANPVTMAAGIAAMGLWTEGAIARLERLGDDLRQRANWALDESGLAFKVTGQGSLFRIMPKRSGSEFRSSVPDARQQVQRRELHLRLLGQGVLTSPTGLGCLSTVMGDGEVAEMVEAIRVSASEVSS